MSEFHSEGHISKIDDDKRQVFGFAYVTHDREGNLSIDKSGDFIAEVEELEKSAYSFVLNSRKGGVDHKRNDDGSEPKVISKMIESMVFTPEKVKLLGLPEGSIQSGWWIGMQIDDDETWGRVKKGELTSFSIHGKGIRKRVAE